MWSECVIWLFYWTIYLLTGDYGFIHLIFKENILTFLKNLESESNCWLCLTWLHWFAILNFFLIYMPTVTSMSNHRASFMSKVFITLLYIFFLILPYYYWVCSIFIVFKYCCCDLYKFHLSSKMFYYYILYCISNFDCHHNLRLNLFACLFCQHFLVAPFMIPICSSRSLLT